MHRKLKRLIFPSVALALSGCVALLPERSQMESSGRYGELTRYEEQQVASAGNASTEQLFNLCYGYAKVKNYKKLFECAGRMEKQIARGDKRVYLPSTRRGLMSDDVGGTTGRSDGSAYPSIFRAEALIDIGNYGKAAAEAQAAVSLCEGVQSTFAGFERAECFISAWGLLGLASALDRNPGAARKAAEALEALPLGIYGIGLTSPKRNQAIAKIQIALGDYKKALEYLGDEFGGIRSLGKVILGSFSESTNIFAHLELPFFYVRGKCLLETGQNEEARSLFDKLLVYPQVEDNGEIYWMLLFDRGRIAEKDGDLAGAIGYYRRAVEVIERQRSTINTEASKIGFAGDKQSVYRQLVAALLSNKEAAAAFEYVERSKSRALVDMLAEKQDFAVTSGDPGKVMRLLAAASQAEAETLVQASGSDRPSTRSMASVARQQLGAESPELASLVNGTSLSASEIQALIPQGEALIEYYHGGDHLVAFVVTRNGLEAVALDGRGLLEDVRQFRERLEEVGSDRHAELSRKLHGRLIAPLADRIGGGKLVIVAHGPLHYLPFNALHDGKAYLIERYSPRMLPSASVLKYARSRPVAKTGEILAFGNPDLGDPRLDLANAQAEAIAVTKNRPQSKALLRKDANESAFRQYGDGFRYIHFATHGEFNAEAPLRSALLLAKDAQSDGLLTVDKLYSLKLDTDLVTLSACETGLGKIASGDDVVGLTRGFLYAGTRSIVATLWKVEDQATSYLMMRFYDYLKNRDKREALRQAQRDTMKQYPHPFFWAAFQLTGNAE